MARKKLRCWGCARGDPTKMQFFYPIPPQVPVKTAGSRRNWALIKTAVRLRAALRSARERLRPWGPSPQASPEPRHLDEVEAARVRH